MKIEIVNIEKIKPYENNAKLHPQEQIEQIKNSIKQFGNNDPIAIDENGVVIEGHERFEALKQLNHTEIPVIKLAHLTDEQKRAYILIHNQLTLNTGFDLEILEAELETINGINMQNFGFGVDISEEIENLGKNEENPEFEQMEFIFHKVQADLIRHAIKEVKDQISETFGNPNKNGNAIYEVVRQWAKQKKLN